MSISPNDYTIPFSIRSADLDQYNLGDGYQRFENDRNHVMIQLCASSMGQSRPTSDWIYLVVVVICAYLQVSTGGESSNVTSDAVMQLHTEQNDTTENFTLLRTDSPLKLCEWEDNTTLQHNLRACEVRTVDMALKHHVAILVPFASVTPLDLACQICTLDNSSDLEWIWAGRNKVGPLFVLQSPGNWILNWSLFEPVSTQSNSEYIKTPCLYRKSFTLHFEQLNASEHLGTYVCTDRAKPDAPTNQIWYHVDTISPYEPTLDELDLPSKYDLYSKVETLSQMQSLQKTIDTDLAAYQEYDNFYHEPFYLTSLVFNNLPKAAPCGTHTIRAYRSCFVRIQPDSIYDMRTFTEEAKLIYTALLYAFDFLVGHHQYDDRVRNAVMRSAAMRRAAELGFYANLNLTDIYVPCQYTLFYHLPKLEGFKPLTTRGFYTDMNYDFVCPELDPMDLINLALERDVTKMQVQILGIEDVRYMKIEKVTIEGSQLMQLTCNLNRPVNCSGERKDVIWKTESGITFTRRTMLNERIYMSGDCSLILQTVERNDSNVYQCFTRSAKNPTMWSRSPYIAYRLSIEKANYKLPELNEFFIGLVILSVWAICIAIMWFILLAYNYHVYSSALLVAAARKHKHEEELNEAENRFLQTQLLAFGEELTTEHSEASGDGSEVERWEEEEDETDLWAKREMEEIDANEYSESPYYNRVGEDSATYASEEDYVIEPKVDGSPVSADETKGGFQA
ncbi:hypothetical protein EG68_05482 [Paragonimus skrjabini miyazakii]|uniref:Ig-like domain-containing protein n=1 Tax=Paragonimus skrjabini miyazakii TaxID=59628 RepID=A0A8S9Z2Y1_9TREM|nr:hypothetical protein EG68_05482 [Paragonimus skrjabini miyazakii]